jgi:hypothetical protein
VTPDLLADVVDLNRYVKAKAYVRTIYRLINRPVGRGSRRPQVDKIPLAFGDASHSFWTYVQGATPGYQRKDPPSQETVNIICDLIVLVEACRTPSSG